MPPTERLRIAIAGLGSRGQFHLERLLLRDDCDVVLAADPDSQARERRRGSICHPASELSPGLLESEGIQAVWLATPDQVTPALVELALRAGCAVVLEPPLGCPPTEVDRLLELARARERPVVLHVPGRAQTEFRQACRVVHSGRLGTLRSLSRSLWQLSPPDPGGAPLLRLARQALPWLDQARILAGGSPRLVWSRHESRRAPEASLPRSAAAAGGTGGLELLVEFGPATIGWLDLQWETPAAWDSGWRLRGSDGVWHASGGTTGSPTGELLEFTLDGEEEGTIDPLDGIFDHLRRKGPNPAAWHEFADLAWWLGQALMSPPET